MPTKSARKARDLGSDGLRGGLLIINRKEKDIMDAQAVANLISTIGFPIAACCAIFYMMNKEREDHKNEVNTLKDVISNINETLAALKQLIEDKLK